MTPLTVPSSQENASKHPLDSGERFSTNSCDQARQWAEQLVGPHFGLIESLQRVTTEPDDVPLHVYAGRLGNTAAFASLEVPRTCSGAGLVAEHALAACIGEGVERYAAGLPAPGALTRAAAGHLPGRAITPDRFVLFSNRQYRQSQRRFPFQRWMPSDPIGWVRARQVESGDPVWVPAAFVYQPYQPASDEPLIAPSLSTGLACGTDHTNAVIAGLCEVIERDAVTLAWIGQIQPPRIDVRDRELSDEVGTIIEMLNQRGFRWAAFDLTTDAGVPVIAALVQGESPVGSIVSFGSACHPNAHRAMLKALIEAVHCRMYVKSLIRREPLWKAGRGFRSVTSFADHARFYSVHGEYRQRLERWWSSTQSVDCRDASAQPSAEWLRKQVETLAGAGYETLVIDLTPPDVVHLGLHVVRVLLPGFQPLHGNHLWPHLGGDRLGRLRNVFGPQVSQPLRWNRYPHPCA